MEIISQWVAHYGYAAIFCLLVLGIVGLPVPDEWLLTLAGYLVFKHHLRAIPTFASALFGSICGITVSYGLGRGIGLYVLHHYSRFFRITPEKLDKVHAWFDRFGKWTLLFGYFIPGVRHFTAVVAGTSKLQYLHFAPYAYVGALVWSATFIGIGFFFGDQWAQVIRQIHHHSVTAAWMVLALAVIYFVWRYLKYNGNKKS
jgi:membrane protein DedA with SNARE-associated domain